MRKKNTNIRGKKKKPNIGKPLKIPYLNLTFLFLFGNIVVIIGVVVFQNNLPPEVPLYYGLPRSTRQLATPLEMVIPLIISLLIMVVNNILALITENEFLKRVLIITSYFITIMAVITVVKIMFLVGTF